MHSLLMYGKKENLRLSGVYMPIQLYYTTIKSELVCVSLFNFELVKIEIYSFPAAPGVSQHMSFSS